MSGGDIYECSLEENAKFAFLAIIWERKRSCKVHFLGFQKVQNPKFWKPWCHLWDILDFFQISRFQLLGGWKVWELFMTREIDLIKFECTLTLILSIYLRLKHLQTPFKYSRNYSTIRLTLQHYMISMSFCCIFNLLKNKHQIMKSK